MAVCFAKDSGVLEGTNSLLRKSSTQLPEVPLLSKQNFSKQAEHFFGQWTALDFECGRLFTVSNLACTSPVDGIKRLSGKTEVTLAEMKKTEPASKLEGIVLNNLFARTEFIKSKLAELTKTEFDYALKLKLREVNPADVEAAIKYYKGKDLQKRAEELLLGFKNSYFVEKSDGGQTDRKIEQYYKLLLKLSYDIALPCVKHQFPTFEDYLKTVDIIHIKGSGSYHRTGRVYLNTHSADVVYIQKGIRQVPIIDPFKIADVVAEEGLRGHQGQFFLTETSNIPAFLKKSVHPLSTINVELVAELAKHSLASELKKNPSIVSEISEQDFSLLENHNELVRERDRIGGFLSAFSDYSYFTKGRDVDAQAQALAEMTGDPYFLSEVSKTVREADFKTVFFKEHSKRVDQWAYVVADMLARKFEKRLDTLDEESRANVLQQLQLGFWPRNSFEEYFDYLCEEATSSPSS